MSLRVSDFMSQIQQRGIARPNLFEIQGRFGGNQGVLSSTDTFMVKSASIPGMEIGEITIPFRGRQLKAPGDRVFADWEITVIADEGYDLHEKFQLWNNALHGTESNAGRSTGRGDLFNGNTGNFPTWRVSSLTREGRIAKTWEIIGCWPKSIGSIDVASDNNDSFAEFSVTLSYQYFTTPRVR